MALSLQDKKLAKDVLRASAVVALAILGCRFTSGGLTLLIGLTGAWAAFSNRLHLAVSCFLFYPFLTIVNGAIKGGATRGMVMRIGLLAMAVALAFVSSKRPGRFSLPIAGVFAYLVVAAISSLFGYSPVISYLRLINFVSLMLGLWLGFKNLQRSPRDLEKIRMAYLGVIGFLILGSLLTVLFPAYGHANDLAVMSGDYTIQELNEVLRNRTGLKLFSGVTNQSQCLAVLLPCAIAWLMCDMLFVERRISKVHTAMIFAGLPLLYMTHSRVALVTTVAAVVMVYGYCLSKIPVRPKLKRAIRSGMVAALALVVLGAIVAEIKDRSVSKFLRKREDLSSDDRSLGEAFTNSRQMLMAESMRDFRSNPLLGKGFQVCWMHDGVTSIRDVATIEKGVLPVMILGETGVLGELVFIAFLAMFYSGCVKRRYVVTMTLMTTFLATNLGEATFFSPGGPGGILWVLCAGGGFVLDTMVVVRRQQEQQALCGEQKPRILRVVRRMPWRFDPCSEKR